MGGKYLRLGKKRLFKEMDDVCTWTTVCSDSTYDFSVLNSSMTICVRVSWRKTMKKKLENFHWYSPYRNKRFSTVSAYYNRIFDYEFIYFYHRCLIFIVGVYYFRSISLQNINRYESISVCICVVYICRFRFSLYWHCLSWRRMVTGVGDKLTSMKVSSIGLTIIACTKYYVHWNTIEHSTAIHIQCRRHTHTTNQLTDWFPFYSENKSFLCCHNRVGTRVPSASSASENLPQKKRLRNRSVLFWSELH